MSLCHAPLTALPLLLSCVLAPAPAGAQPSQPGNYDYLEGDLRFTAPMVVLLVVLVTAFLFIGFFLVYVRHCRHDAAGSADASAVPALTRRRQQRGLDAEVLESFPTMKYAEAKELRVGKDAALECAVCLSEFDDEEQLTFLPKCSHAFHPDCIREWLASHVTCPVCRCNLEADRDVAGESGVTVPETSASEEPAIRQEEDSTGAQPAEVVIDVNTEEEERRKEAVELERIGSHRRAMRSPSGRAAERLARSHTTGHSVAFRFDGNLEQFTLRLPDHVRREMVAAGEESLRRWRRTGEGSSRGGGGRRVLLGRERLPSFLARTFSARVPFWAASRRAADGEGGEGSTTKRPPAADVAAAAAAAAGSGNGGVRFDCLGGGISGARVGAAAGEDDEKEIARQV